MIDHSGLWVSACNASTCEIAMFISGDVTAWSIIAGVTRPVA